MEWKCSTFQEKTTAFQEKVHYVEAYHDEAKLYDSHSTLASSIAKLESFLEPERKRPQKTDVGVMEVNCRAKEAWKSLQ